MKKSEIFSKFAEIVCERCEVHLENILNGNKLQTVVDARVILIHELTKYGFSPHDIAVTSLRFVAGGLSYDLHYVPDPDAVAQKSKSITKQIRAYEGYRAATKMFRGLSDDVSEAISKLNLA